MKYFLLTAGDDYYPLVGTEDWIGTYASWDEASNEVESVDELWCKYQIQGESYDWFEIVDLRDWINRKKD